MVCYSMLQYVGQMVNRCLRLPLLCLLVCLIILPGCGNQDTAAAEREVLSVQASEDIGVGRQQKYTMEDVGKLRHTEIFAKGALGHIFEGEINKKGKAVGFHCSQIENSKGKILEGTRSKTDRHGVFTAKVEIAGVKKNGFSSFYPSDWTPQEVVDSIHRAYQDALKDPDNPHGSLWIGYDGNIEIDMYLDGEKKIKTAYPVFKGD